MLRSVNELNGYTIAATDGDIGNIRTFYFDDEYWTIRHLVVGTGGWLRGRLVLVSPIAIGQVEWPNRYVSVNLTKAQIEQSPGVAFDKLVSRQYELQYYDYYGWPYYWAGPYAWGFGMEPSALAAAKRLGRTAVAEQECGDPHLRDCAEVISYHIQATDGEIGHVEDFLVDEQTWQIRYMVVDTSSLWSGKRVLIAPEWIARVSWFDQQVSVDLSKHAVKDSPQWDPSVQVERVYEERLYSHYGRPWNMPKERRILPSAAVTTDATIHSDFPALVPGNPVYSAEGERLGTVKEVLARDSSFKVAVTLHGDYWLRTSTIQRAVADSVVLAFGKDQLDTHKSDIPE